MNLRFQKWDIAVITGIVLLAVLLLCFFLPGKNAPGAYAEIYQDGHLFKTVSLQEDQEITIAGKYTNVITVENGRIAVTASDCPGEDCVHCGWLESTGRTIVCIPNGLEIRVIADGDVDFVVG